MLEEALGGILCIYDLWAHMRKDVGRYQLGGIRCVYGRWAHVCCNASQCLQIPSELRGLEISGNFFSVVIFYNQG